MFKRNLKLLIVPAIYIMAIIMFVLSIYTVGKIINSQKLKNKERTNYVSYELVTDNEYIPVIYVEPTVMRPYLKDNVTINKSFYNYEAEETEQENAIIVYQNTYIQNSGTDYTSKESFEIISTLDGTVIDVSDNEILGKTVKIRHNNEIVSTYQCLSDVTVKNNDTVLRGQIIGNSGTCNLYNKDNNLHFELSYQGKTIDPEKSYDKTENEL